MAPLASGAQEHSGACHAQAPAVPDKWGGIGEAVQKTPPEPCSPGGDVDSSCLQYLFAADRRASGLVLVQIELPEQFPLPGEQGGQPAFVLEGLSQFQPHAVLPLAASVQLRQDIGVLQSGVFLLR